jgi:type IV pilus assembly protein PilM
MAKKTVALYIDDTSIKLLVTHDKKIKKWADLPLEPGLVKNGVVLKDAEVAERIKQLLKVRKVSTKRINIGISGLHCLTRPLTLPQLPREMLEEAVRREAKRVLPVPLEQVSLAWQSISSQDEKTRVFLTALPSKNADALFRMLAQAGLKAELLDLKPLLVSRFISDTKAIIVDFQPTEFDIIVKANGIPQPIRTVSLPSQALNWQEKLLMVRNDLNRTIEFYNSNNPDDSLDDSVPIFVSGELANEPETCQSLSYELGLKVLPLVSPLECPVGLDANLFMPNISLALKSLSMGHGPEPSVGDLNVLPAHYRPEPFSLTNILVPPMAVAALGLFFFLVIMIQNTSSEMAATRGELETTEQLLQQRTELKQSLGQNIAELEKQITEAQTSGGNFAAAVALIEQQVGRVNGNLEVTVAQISGGVSLATIGQSNPSLNLVGSAPSREAILAYLGELQASGQFSQVTITSIRKASDERMDFTATLISTGE